MSAWSHLTDLFTTQKSIPHGHVEGILEMIGRLKLDRLISAQPCRERDLVVALIVQRLIDPCSKLTTTREWHTSTLAEELGVAEATETDLYEAMDFWGARSASRKSWLLAICARVAWCSMTCRAVFVRGGLVPWRNLVMIAMERKGCRSSSTE